MHDMNNPKYLKILITKTQMQPQNIDPTNHPPKEDNTIMKQIGLRERQNGSDGHLYGGIVGELRRISPQGQLERDIQLAHGIVFSRTGHCAFFYKNSIYYYGGSQLPIPSSIPTSQPLLPTTDPTRQQARQQSLYQSLHKFNLATKQYSKQNINLSTNLNFFINLSEFGWLLIGNLLFLFGGLNWETRVKRVCEVFSVNLDNGAVKRYQSKTSASSIPTPRTNPIITTIQKSILLIFGGIVHNPTTDTPIFLNDLYIFKLQTKTWTKIQQSLEHRKFPILLRPSLINFSDNCIYLLGGKREILRNDGSGVRLVDSGAVYRLRIVNKTINSKSDCCVKEVFSGNCNGVGLGLGDGLGEEERGYVRVMKFNEKGIFAVTGEKGLTTTSYNFWYYDIVNLIWTQIKYTPRQGINMAGLGSSDFIVCQDRVIIIQNSGEICELSFSSAALEAAVKETLTGKIGLCSLCEIEKSNNVEPRNSIPAQKLQQFCSPLQFPYAAIALLVDNTLLTKSKTCSLYFNTTASQKQPSSQTDPNPNPNPKSAYLIIEDNGSPSHIWSNELRPMDYVNKVCNFYATIIPEDLMAAQDNRKEILKNFKEIEEKERNLQREFSLFLKNQNKSNAASNQSNFSIPNTHFKTEKDFQKQQHEYIQKKQRLEFKKIQLQSDQKFRRFCNSLKLAGIRLGDCISYACKHKKNEQLSDPPTTQKQKQIRRYFFLRKQRCPSSGKSYYFCYAYVTENGNAADPRMEGLMKQVGKEFKKELKMLTERLKNANSVVLVSELRNFNLEEAGDRNMERPMSMTKQLRLKKKQNDIFYGQPQILTTLQSTSLTKMSQLSDISLKTYLSLLYLKPNDLTTFLSIRQNPPQQINTQPFLPTIDRILSTKKIIQITKPLDFSDECSVVEIYWYPEHGSGSGSGSGEMIGNRVNSLGFMLNGLLVYQGNRLVGRYGVGLGRLLDEGDGDGKGRAGGVFGYLEVKDEYVGNFYLTGMFYPGSFEKYYSRLEFVSEFMENNYKEKRGRGRDDGHAGYQKISKRVKNQ